MRSDHAQGSLKVLFLGVDLFQIAQHAQQHVFFADGGQELGQLAGKRVVRPVHGPQLVFHLRLADPAAGLEGVEDGFAVRSRVFDDEMAGKADPYQRYAQAVTDLNVDQRERNRNAELAVEDFVEKAVARVVVVGLVAGQALLLKQDGVQGLDDVGKARGFGQT